MDDLDLALHELNQLIGSMDATTTVREQQGGDYAKCAITDRDMVRRLTIAANRIRRCARELEMRRAG